MIPRGPSPRDARGATRHLARLLAFHLLVLPAAAHADLFSPGPLAKAHKGAEGLRNCTKCHEAGSGLSQERCLSCHPQIQVRMNGNRGFHGHIAASERDCQRCHHDHRGEDFAMVDWGPGGQKAFDHNRTGWGLEGSHAKVECKKCHDERLVTDGEVRKLFAKRSWSFLGAPTTCKACHFDEHRGQLGTDCKACHEVKKFKPAPGFNHGKTKFALKGKHQTVACEKCHPQKLEQLADVFPAARAPTYLQFSNVPHETCDTCHKDPHEGRFGNKCQSCHVEQGWKVMGGMAKEREFHEKTRYPLRGEHATVACKSCHGPLPGMKARFKGLAFRHCSDCHADAHLGQMAATSQCEDCHDVNGFVPARFDLEKHASTKYPLESAHAAVPCSSCHPEFQPLKKRITPALARKGRKLLVSLARFEFPDTRDCQTCHEDPHQAQFADKVKAGGCPTCHQLSSFADVKFDHQKDTRYPLLGKHAGATCVSCHPEEKKGRVRFVRYRPLQSACGSCHADVHATQLAGADGVTDCARCHGNDSFARAEKYVHAPPFTSFTLDGKHAQVACEKCHAPVQVAAGVTVTRYKGLPATCEGCHADFHEGAMRRFVP